MTFTSFNFLLFFPVVVFIYNLLPQRFRVTFLLLASYVFYTFMQPAYLVLLIAVTLVTYGITRWMNKTKEDEKKRKIEVLGIILVLLPLFFFKYFNSINESIVSLLSGIGISATLPTISWMLPVGISFYTFMAIGYIVDVYNEEVEVERNVGNVGLFLSFFPIVLSGPIERAGSMLPQLKHLQRSTPADLTAGLKMMLWGYFMKLCIADRLSIYVDVVFNNIEHHNGTTLLLASFLYPFQVYADLGGYSLVAIGVAKCVGINIRPNFRRPFFATSMSELWRRWHMSLITWLTDYIYTPLSFSLRKWKLWGIILSLMLTFLISGLWHGAALTFIFWGLIQGIYLSIEAVTMSSRAKIEKKYFLTSKWWYILLCCCIVFILFAFSQIFARCNSLTSAMEVLTTIFTERGIPFLLPNFVLCILFVFILLFKDFLDEYYPSRMAFIMNIGIIRWGIYYTVIALILITGILESNSYLYFKF